MLTFEFLLRVSGRDLEGLGLEDKGWRGTDDELKLLGVDDKTFQFNSEYLLSVGVMVRLPKFEFKGETGHLIYHEEYFVTQYGKEFVEYVRDQELMEEVVAEEMTNDERQNAE